ncbi:hypothetical protein [Rivibacter subsaxonicus]|uniref:Transmembrane protein n=1 Tax=Rivibacter subsaxonicus TaxID=457575 RepID=A0A4Q7V598_9BURK|nr:hypothetical protein [Rivibacter subsaxonicus]RZT91445.1 hypothetical protein EV670_3716 [Rivibacter subsaxonicus]
MQIDLVDAMAVGRAHADQTHKFWGYFQVVTAAALALAWSSHGPPEQIRWGLALGYAGFAFFNWRLVRDSQAASFATWSAITNYCKTHPAQITPEFSNLPTLNRPMRPWIVALGHALLSLLALAALVAAAQVTRS